MRLIDDFIHQARWVRVILEANILVVTTFRQTPTEADEAARGIRAAAEVVEISGNLRRVSRCGGW